MSNRELKQVTENKMGTKGIKWLLFTMSFPPMISMITNALYNIIDSIFVAKISEKSLTAVTIAFPLQMIMIAIMVGIGVGLASLISRRLGEKRQEDADSAATHGIVLGLFCYVVFLLVGIFLTPFFVRLFTDDPEIISQSVLYLRIVMMGSIFMCISIPIERILQATGNMIAPMAFNMAGAGINCFLAPVFILGLFGAPRLGVLGAGLVAIFGQGITLLIALIVFHRGKHLVHIDFRHFKFHGRTIEDIFLVALPTIIMLSINSLMISLMNMILISFSASAVAVLGAYFRIQQFIFMPVFGMCQGALPLLGYNYGAKNKSRFIKIYKIAIIVAVFIMGMGTLIFHIFTYQILELFSAEGDMLTIGVVALRTISLSFIPASFTIVTVAVFQALAHGIAAMILSILRQLVIIIPLAYIFSHSFGLNMVWWAFPIAETFAFIYAGLYFIYVYKKQIRDLKYKDS